MWFTSAQEHFNVRSGNEHTSSNYTLVNITNCASGSCHIFTLLSPFSMKRNMFKPNEAVKLISDDLIIPNPLFPTF